MLRPCLGSGTPLRSSGSSGSAVVVPLSSAGGAYSYAPMSGARPTMRARPSGSVDALRVSSSPASIVGDPAAGR
jgi:hypothetical protein